MTENSSLVYFIAEKNHCLIVTLIGSLMKQDLPALNSMIEEVAASHAKLVIFNFRDVKEIDEAVFSTLIDMQKRMRMKPSAVRLCSLHPDLKKRLLSLEIISAGELSNNLTEALFSMSHIKEFAA